MPTAPTPSASVGLCIQLHHTLLGLCQSDLGRIPGLTFQKTNAAPIALQSQRSIGWPMPWNVPAPFFCDDQPKDRVENLSLIGNDALGWRESLELLRHCHRIPKSMQKHIHGLVNVMGTADHSHKAKEKTCSAKMGAR